MVRCANCGFVGARHSETREVVEVTSDDRPRGKVRMPKPEDRPAVLHRTMGYGVTPFCTVAQADFRAEAKDSTWDAVMDRERVCPMHVPYFVGFTPKEHMQMFQLQQEQRMRDQIEERRHIEIKDVTMRAAAIGGIFGLIGVVLGALIAIFAQR